MWQPTTTAPACRGSWRRGTPPRRQWHRRFPRSPCSRQHQRAARSTDGRRRVGDESEQSSRNRLEPGSRRRGALSGRQRPTLRPCCPQPEPTPRTRNVTRTHRDTLHRTCDDAQPLHGLTIRTTPTGAPDAGPRYRRSITRPLRSDAAARIGPSRTLHSPGLQQPRMRRFRRP